MAEIGPTKARNVTITHNIGHFEYKPYVPKLAA